MNLPSSHACTSCTPFRNTIRAIHNNLVEEKQLKTSEPLVLLVYNVHVHVYSGTSIIRTLSSFCPVVSTIEGFHCKCFFEVECTLKVPLLLSLQS